MVIDTRVKVHTLLSDTDHNFIIREFTKSGSSALTAELYAKQCNYNLFITRDMVLYLVTNKIRNLLNKSK